ncbi:MAG: SUF system NifU family Fe-S cluster assembly protein [Alphaproteobacteria bacterium]
MSDLRDLYQEVIVDHSKRPRNFGALADANRKAEGHNPLCGDSVTVYLSVVDGVVKDVQFEGRGCAISMASASLMTESLKGMGVDEARSVFERFHGMVTGKDESLDDSLDRLAVFEGVREFPVRVKCATLAWHTFMAALEARDGAISTE